jgi:uncharacterized protein YoxC
LILAGFSGDNSNPMQPWAQLVLVVCAVALTAALVAAILALRKALSRTEAVLTIVEQELRPLIGQAHGLTEDIRELTRESRREVERIGEVTEHVARATDGVGRMVVGLAGLTRAGQIVGLAAGLRRGVDVFVNRLRRDEGDNDGH